MSPLDMRTLLYATQDAYQDQVPVRGAVAVKSSVRLFISGVEVPQNHPTFGWALCVDTTYTKGDRRFKIMFNTRMRLTNPTIQVQYITTAPHCLKCCGLGKISDYTIAQNGSLTHVTDFEKLTQRIYKFLLTSTCNFYPSFTSRLKSFMGMKIAGSVSTDDISNECSNALIQTAQKNIQTLSPQEVLKDIESIESVRDENDPTVVRTSLYVTSYGTPRALPLAFTLRTTNN